MNPISPFKGISNFRDLGGLLTTGGRQIRPGALFRSDALSALTDEDHSALQTIGLRCICDLRDESERIRHPNRLPDGESITQHAIGFMPIGGHALLKSLGADSTGDHVHEAIEDSYRHFSVEHAENFARLFDILLSENSLPLLVHCTSGKDRTGFGIALILSALGIPRDTIRADYLRSNEAPRNLRDIVAKDIHDDALLALMRVRVEYLDAGLSAIDANWGSMDIFLERKIGLSASRRAQLQESLLITG